MVIKTVFLFILLGLITFYSLPSQEMSKLAMSVLMILVFLTLILFKLTKDRNINLNGQFLKHSTLFLIGFFIVHFQYYIDFILGNVSKNNLDIWINITVVLQSFVLSFIGIISFFLGYLQYNGSLKIRKCSNENKPVGVKLLSFLALLALLVYFLTANPLYLAGFYGTEKMGAEATYAILFFTILIFAVIIQNCRNIIIERKVPSNFKTYIKLQGYFLTSLITVYLLSVMISGDRAPIITIGIAYFSGYFVITKKKFNWKLGFISVLIGAIFISLLGIARSMDKSLDFKTKIVQSLSEGNRFNESSFIPQTQELAGSVRALHTTVNYIPEKHGFLYGRFQFQQIAVAIPFFNIFTPILFSDNSAKYNGSSSFVTWVNQGDHPTSGEGTTCIADFYFDFGVIGVVVGMFLFGYILHWAETSIYTLTLPQLFTHAFSVVYLSYSLFISRSSFLFNFRTVFWVFLVLVINKYLFNRKPQ